MTTKWLVSVATLVFAGVLIPSSTLAHPPHAPYDDTHFAPITRFGPSVGVEVVATGLVAPVKGVAAPGQPNRLYVVDQPGILWAIDLNTNTKSVFLDVRVRRLVTLGVCGPNTFDERGLLGVAFHPNYAAEWPALHLHLRAEHRAGHLAHLHPRYSRPSERDRRVAGA